MEAKKSYLTKEILRITLEIQTQFPELYVLLSETPLIPSKHQEEINLNDLRQYLFSIIKQKKDFEKGIKQFKMSRYENDSII
ncbi:hypothetical protein IQ37_01930 [Chryseobacterium piperi]|uniref:Uncharacterized protein n=1 Tax=Chryseobacterium piperi TaxID=558152 RepID=A0A086BLZ1_9FLAO|nr:hypothetical protein [Chryseobacterium piperi]ASW75802.1 hypothetical protein CJF12_16950 [Chryseobacterium piperi]KFF29955.1 hypothetical protein IQ37_01930 [Chryseobacterium piperi]